MQKFIIIIPVYNAADYIGRCLASVISQEYKNYSVIIIDDCSTDRTWDYINCYQEFKSYHNKNRIGSGLANIIKGIELIKPSEEDVIITLDGDDYLENKYVLSYLNEVYKDDVWMTYGQYVPISGKYNNFCKPIPDTGKYRKSNEWFTSHLRTFKYWLFDSIKDEDLRDETGQYFKVAWDRAFMYPMIEMSGCHCKFIDKVLYVYNDLNPNCDMKLFPKESEETAGYIINKPEYKEL